MNNLLDHDIVTFLVWVSNTCADHICPSRKMCFCFLIIPSSLYAFVLRLHLLSFSEVSLYGKAIWCPVKWVSHEQLPKILKKTHPACHSDKRGVPLLGGFSAQRFVFSLKYQWQDSCHLLQNYQACLILCVVRSDVLRTWSPTQFVTEILLLLHEEHNLPSWKVVFTPEW